MNNRHRESSLAYRHAFIQGVVLEEDHRRLNITENKKYKQVVNVNHANDVSDKQECEKKYGRDCLNMRKIYEKMQNMKEVL